MGCSNNKIENINFNVLDPPLRTVFKNTRVKTELFPEGVIYYLRNYKEVQK